MDARPVGPRRRTDRAGTIGSSGRRYHHIGCFGSHLDGRAAGLPVEGATGIRWTDSARLFCLPCGAIRPWWKN